MHTHTLYLWYLQFSLRIKGLQEKIKLVPIDLKNRLAWYKKKVYPANKVYFILSVLKNTVNIECTTPDLYKEYSINIYNNYECTKLFSHIIDLSFGA